MRIISVRHRCENRENAVQGEIIGVIWYRNGPIVKFATKEGNADSAYFHGVSYRRTGVDIKKKVINEIGCAKISRPRNGMISTAPGVGGTCIELCSDFRVRRSCHHPILRCAIGCNKLWQY